MAEADPLLPLPCPAQGASIPPHPYCQPDPAPSAVGRGLQVTCLQPSTLPIAGPNRPRDIPPPSLAQTSPFCWTLTMFHSTGTIRFYLWSHPGLWSSCPHALRISQHLLSLPLTQPKEQSLPHTPARHSYPTCSQHKCKQGPLAAALHLICIYPRDCQNARILPKPRPMTGRPG